MARMTTKLTTALAGLALCSLPVLADAQSTTPQQPDRPTQSEQSQQQQRSRTSDQNSPEHHLNMAKQVLNQINPSSLQGEARTQITELKRNFNQLENAWRNESRKSDRPGESAHASGHTGTTGTSGTTGSTTSEQTGTTSGTMQSERPRSESASPMAGNDDWKRHYQAIDSTLDELLGQGSSTAGTTGTTGTTGARPSESSNIDASLRSKLTEFRGHLEKFHAAAIAQSGNMGREDRASANPHSGMTGSMSGTTGTSGSTTAGTAGTAGSTTSGTTGTTGSTATGTMTSGTSGQAASSSQARTSSSQQVDSATIARLTASIDEILRSSSASGTAGTTGTSGTTSSTASGTAGTSSTSSANATVCVDRAKLEQLRRDIQALGRNQ